MKYLYLLVFGFICASCSTDGEITLTPDLSGIDIQEASKEITVFEGVLDGVESVFYFDTTEPLTGYTCLTVNNIDYHLYLQSDLINPVVGSDSIIATCDPYTYKLTIITDSDLPLVGF